MSDTNNQNEPKTKPPTEIKLLDMFGKEVSIFVGDITGLVSRINELPPVKKG